MLLPVLLAASYDDGKVGLWQVVGAAVERLPRRAVRRGRFSERIPVSTMRMTSSPVNKRRGNA
jgi:hypothetical protein